MRKVFLLFFLLFCLTEAHAQIESSKVSEFKKACLKAVKPVGKAAKICDCESRNFKWLIPKSNWSDFKKLYFSDSKESRVADELQPLEIVIYEVTTKCDKKHTYTAPKVKTLMAQPKAAD